MSKPLSFVMVSHNILDAPAWRAASHGARSLYVVLKRRWNHNRKNLVYLSERDAARELGSDRNQIRRWFTELVYYGFIVLEKPGYLGVNGKGRAPYYRLTECQTIAPKDSEAPIIQATRDFDKWNGVPFSVAGGFCGRKNRDGKDTKFIQAEELKTESRTRKHIHPGRENTSTSGRENTSTQPVKWVGKHIHRRGKVDVKTHPYLITILGGAGGLFMKPQSTPRGRPELRPWGC
jgi:hypothetical protein